MCSIISSSIIYRTTWTTVKIQLQNMTTCHAIHNVGCMHIFALPLRFLLYGKLRTFSLLQGSQMGFWLTILLLCTWLYVTSLRSGNCQFWMQGVLPKSLHVMWKCRSWTPYTLDPLQLRGLNSVCLNGYLWLTSNWRIMPSYVVISFHKWLNHYIIFLQPSNFVSVVLRVWKERVFKGQLMPRRTLLPNPILQAPNFTASVLCIF
jgi:hypothetical protein